MDESLRTRRTVCAALWLVVLLAAVLGLGGGDGALILLAWLAALVLTVATVGLARLSRDEVLFHPHAYRVMAGLLFGLALAGAALALVPDATDTSQLFGVWFGVMAICTYRAVLARGPRAAMMAVAIGVCSWLPFAFVTLVGCKCRRFAYVVHWSELATHEVVKLLLLALPVLAVGALLGFRPRADTLPPARALQHRE